MATQTWVVTLSDLSGAEDAATVKFGMLGRDYEIDLTSEELATFESLMETYVSKARPTGGRRNAPAGVRGVRSADARPGGAQAFTGVSSKVIREWAETQGIEIPSRGRIPMHVQEAFVAAREAPAPEPAPEPVPTAANGAAKRTRARKAVAEEARKAVAELEFVAPPVESKPPTRRRRIKSGA